MRKKNRGEVLTQSELLEIASNFIISRHAKDRLLERSDFDTVEKIKEKILNPYVAYFNTDGSINIAVDKYNYFVVVERNDGGFLIVTYKEPSLNGIDILTKQSLAKKGKSRTA